MSALLVPIIMNESTAKVVESRNSTRSGWISSWGLIAWLVLCFGAAAVGSQFGPGEWYAGLRKPSWNPPSWVFAPVWTALYTLMGIAAWLIWRRGGWKVNRLALTAFLTQLVLNAAWSWLFFGLRNPGLAFAEILLLWLAIVWTWRLFRRINPAAGALLGPYLAWVSFAAVLNAVLWRLNSP